MAALAKLSNLFDEYFSDRKSTTLILGSSVSLILVSYWIRNYIQRRRFFDRMKLQSPKPLPIIGNFLGVLRNGLIENDIYMMKTYGKTCGFFEGSTPTILTIDVKFIKAILIKDFSSFVNRRIIESFSIEPSDKFLTNLKDDEWKNVRSILTTTFTSGKLKSMSKCIQNCIKNYDNYLQELVEKDGILATKTLFGCFTLDVISSCCFGMDTNSISDPDSEFLRNIQLIFSVGFENNPKMALAFITPDFASFMAKHNLMEFFPIKPLKFLEGVTNAIIERRKSKIDTRDDFIQYMIDHEDNSKQDEKDPNNKEWNGHLKKTLTNKELLSQAILFLAAGYETTASTLQFIAYNLATYPDIQNKLLEEIDEVLEKHNGEVNYDSISEMKYMEMVIDETMRIYPPATRLERVANADYEYEGLKIKKGQIITVPIYALHHDPDIYPNPEVFDPERFSDENKKTRESVAFLPFGAGPRNCIGMRFAIIEIKLFLASILAKYRFGTCEKTEKIKLQSFGLLKPSKPIIVKVEKR